MQEKPSTNWRRGPTAAALLLAWGIFAAWQWQEYQAECKTARDALRRQAELVVKALVGGVQSHRQLGRFVEEQLQAALDELAGSQEVLAAALISTDNRISLTAGNAGLLDLSTTVKPGQEWQESGFLYAAAFQVLPDRPGPGMGPFPGMRPGPGMGPPRQDGREADDPEARGVEPFRGPGPGRGDGRRRDAADRRPTPDDAMPPPVAGRFTAVLLLDRSETDRQMRNYAWLRALVVGAGGVVIFSAVLAWRATVRLTEARGRAQLLEIEARHLRDLSQAATGLAHETRNPLGLIRGWTQRWMHSLPADGPQRPQAQAVIEECDRVTARINQFLAFARPCKPRLAAVRPGEVVAELAALVAPDLDAKRLKLAASPPAEQTIEADREMFRQALFNLIQNAVQFSPEGSAIDVSFGSDREGTVRIEVADRGPGVPPEAVELLFTPYHTTRPDGAGLGLAIVRRIAAAHGWRTGYSPRPGGGAIFWIADIPAR